MVSLSQYFNVIIPNTLYLVLDFQNLQNDHLHENSRISRVLLDFPILVELIEEMMFSRYHLISDNEKWSEDALDFHSCALSGSLETLMNVRSHYPQIKT